MDLIDTHCHIYYDKYNNDIEEVVKRAHDNHVKKMICVAVDYDSAIKSIELANKYHSIYATAGYHPHDSKDTKKGYITSLEKLLENKKVVAVGETGLDYYYEYSDKKKQIKAFIEQLELAKSTNKPIIIHCREAEKDILKCIKETNSTKGVVHCFSGDLNFANRLFELGFYISFTGLVTFNKKLTKVIKEVPLDKFMLETDSPYLTPVPHRGKRNEPWLVKIIAQEISKIKNISIKDIAEETTKNATKLFEI